MGVKNINRYIAVACVFILSLLAGQKEAHAQQVGVKTNALMWAAMTPNIVQPNQPPIRFRQIGI